jgi:hypothetical protein
MCMHKQKQLTRKEMKIFIPKPVNFCHCSRIWRCNIKGRFYHKIGKEICKQKVAGKYILHEVTSVNGQKLMQFAQMQDMFVLSTKYDDKDR